MAQRIRSVKSLLNRSELDYSGIAFFHHLTQNSDTTPSKYAD